MRLNFMKKWFKNNVVSSSKEEGQLLNEFIKTQSEVSKLPQLSDVEKVKFELDIATDHLYYSSRIEGSNLNKERLNKAIYAQQGV